MKSSAVRLLWISCALLLGISGCGSDDPCGCSDDGGTLIFRRDDGSPISFPPDAQALVWCGEWEPGTVADPTLHVFFGSGTQDTPGWRLRVVLADAAVGDTLSIPNSFIWSAPDSLDFFFFDPPNELSSQVPESSGFLVFQQLSCDVGSIVEFELDAVLASEVAGLPPISVQGRFVGTVGESPTANAKAGTLSRVPALGSALEKRFLSR